MMKRILGIAQFLLLSSAAVHAACSGRGTSWSCPAGASVADVQAAINAASDGAVITLAAGSYTWGSYVSFSQTKGITLICASAPATAPPWGASTTAPCTINVASVSDIIGLTTYSGANNHLYRISGFTFDATSRGTNAVQVGSISFGGPPTGGASGVLSQVRIDHNSFLNYYKGSDVILFGDTTGSGLVYGVADHNYLRSADYVAFMVFITCGEGTLSCSLVPAQPVALGTANNFFIEDNTIIWDAMTNNSAAGCIDTDGAASLVMRHNSSTNCLWSHHRENYGGGSINSEFYNNTVTLNSNATGDEGTPGNPSTITGYRMYHNQGAGTSIFFNNTFGVPAGNAHSIEVMSMLNYRDTDAASEAVRAGACDGTMSNFGPWHISDGDRKPSGTWYGYPCWHMASRGNSGEYRPIYVWNNQWQDGAGGIANGSQAGFNWPDIGGIQPDGSFPQTNCTAVPATGTCGYYSVHVKANREYYVAVSNSPNDTPTSPFNGSTGMGFGPTANRPATCTQSSENTFGGNAGTGYFDTTTSTLYTCGTTGWVVYYTPYTYPHPLVNSGASPTAPTHLAAVVQ
jgi:hypothetical protein